MAKKIGKKLDAHPVCRKSAEAFVPQTILADFKIVVFAWTTPCCPHGIQTYHLSPIVFHIALWHHMAKLRGKRKFDIILKRIQNKAAKQKSNKEYGHLHQKHA